MRHVPVFLPHEPRLATTNPFFLVSSHFIQEVRKGFGSPSRGHALPQRGQRRIVCRWVRIPQGIKRKGRSHGGRRRACLAAIYRRPRVRTEHLVLTASVTRPERVSRASTPLAQNMECESGAGTRQTYVGATVVSPPVSVCSFGCGRVCLAPLCCGALGRILAHSVASCCRPSVPPPGTLLLQSCTQNLSAQSGNSRRRLRMAPRADENSRGLFPFAVRWLGP